MGGGRNKREKRRRFEARHEDQVWRDAKVSRSGDRREVHDGSVGPLGTTDRSTLDEDVPGYGKHYCIPCSRYFVSGKALTDHEKTKAHKRLAKLLESTPQPHSQKDADRAGGMGLPDNGMILRKMQIDV